MEEIRRHFTSFNPTLPVTCLKHMCFSQGGCRVGHDLATEHQQGSSIAQVCSFSDLSCVWLHPRIGTFHPLPHSPAVSLSTWLPLSLSLFFAACLSMVAGAFLLVVLILSLVLLSGAPKWWVPPLCPGSPWLKALSPLKEGECVGIQGHGHFCVLEYSIFHD